MREDTTETDTISGENGTQHTIGRFNAGGDRPIPSLIHALQLVYLPVVMRVLSGKTQVAEFPLVRQAVVGEDGHPNKRDQWASSLNGEIVIKDNFRLFATAPKFLSLKNLGDLLDLLEIDL